MKQRKRHRIEPRPIEEETVLQLPKVPEYHTRNPLNWTPGPPGLSGRLVRLGDLNLGPGDYLIPDDDGRRGLLPDRLPGF